MSSVKNVTVIGSGTMGNGIAHVFALHDFNVSLYDVSEPALERALETIKKNLERQVAKEMISDQQRKKAFANIKTSTDIRSALASSDLVVEAATENEKVKLQIFKDADEFAPAHAILATNTSSISITTIAAATKRPQQVIGMHFMNPVPVMKLIEVIKGYQTSEETTSAIVEISKSLGKVPVEANDYPGFVANRILLPMINEAIYALHEGVSGVEEIDTVMKLGMAHPMGPLQLADFIGLDVCLSILNVLYDGFKQPKFAPCPLLVNMVKAGHFGVKSGEGFYKYTKGSKETVVAGRFSSVDS